MPRKPNSLFLGDPNLDLAISLNLLSQLPCMPERYLRDCRRHSPDEILTFCRGLVEEHLAYLLRLPGRVTLLSDVEVRTLAEAGQVISRKPTLYGVEFPWREHTWEWTLVPRRRAWPHRSEILQVVGIEDLGRTMRRIILPGQ